MSRRYMAVSFGSDYYLRLLVEEDKKGLRIINRERIEVNRESLNENGFDREALKRLFLNADTNEYLVLIPGSNVLSGILEFPLTERKKIENALRFELESEIMEDPESLLFDYRVINNQEKKTQVVYYAIRKDDIKRLLSELSTIGIDPPFLVAHQNVYSGLYKSIFDKGSTNRTKLFVDYNNKLLTLSFVDASGNSFGRTLEVDEPERDREIVKNFIITTFQYYRIRSRRDVIEAYIVSDESSMRFFYEILTGDIGISSVTMLRLKDSASETIESEFVMLYSALNGRVELTKREIINFRKDEFAYRGEYDFIKRQLIKYGVALSIVILLSILLTIYKFRMLARYEEELNKSLAEVTKQILGKPYDNFTTALAVIKSKTEPKNLSIPTNSAFDYFMFISDSFPQDVDVDIRTLDIGDKKIRIEGETDSFESVDRLVNSLKKNGCFKDITKGKVKKSPDGKRIDFDLSITPSC